MGKLIEEYFCPYCGDELNSEEDIESQEYYYKTHGQCSHWDETNRITDF